MNINKLERDILELREFMHNQFTQNSKYCERILGVTRQYLNGCKKQKENTTKVETLIEYYKVLKSNKPVYMTKTKKTINKNRVEAK